jgi:hypothetical protein
MYPDGIGGIFLVLNLVILIWLGILTVWFWKSNTFIKKLFPQDQGTFKDKLEEVLKEFTGLEDFKKSSLDHVQKVSLKRYNPYQDTGGDQSFSVAMLDGHGDGLIISSLHSRAGTRVFAKPIKAGKEDKVQLSEEESLVVKQAMMVGKNNKNQ